jgi:hypothetical protein
MNRVHEAHERAAEVGRDLRAARGARAGGVARALPKPASNP